MKILKLAAEVGATTVETGIFVAASVAVIGAFIGSPSYDNARIENEITAMCAASALSDLTVMNFGYTAEITAIDAAALETKLRHLARLSSFGFAEKTLNAANKPVVCTGVFEVTKANPAAGIAAAASLAHNLSVTKDGYCPISLDTTEMQNKVINYAAPFPSGLGPGLVKFIALVDKSSGTYQITKNICFGTTKPERPTTDIMATDAMYDKMSASVDTQAHWWIGSADSNPFAIASGNELAAIDNLMGLDIVISNELAGDGDEQAGTVLVGKLGDYFNQNLNEFRSDTQTASSGTVATTDPENHQIAEPPLLNQQPIRINPDDALSGSTPGQPNPAQSPVPVANPNNGVGLVVCPPNYSADQTTGTCVANGIAVGYQG